MAEGTIKGRPREASALTQEDAKGISSATMRESGRARKTKQTVAGLLFFQLAGRTPLLRPTVKANLRPSSAITADWFWLVHGRLSGLFPFLAFPPSKIHRT
ncbi:hypothetical protein J3458_004737 [Metarhizium acridum]|uniref:uncharacterized protein n=1 Tax=Metarhizium acridum TaxID=92637 RepID=UPI001C6A98A1|nr:hypothetical protein J3458_004737 [Metarhizium acridum]